MRAGYNGRIAISWNQMEIDWLEAGPLERLVVGAVWSWRGQAIQLDQFEERSGLSAGFSSDAAFGARGAGAGEPQLSGRCVAAVELTNGAQKFAASILSNTEDNSSTLIFENGCPPRDEEFWISNITEFETLRDVGADSNGTVVAFPSPAPIRTSWHVGQKRVAATSPARRD